MENSELSLDTVETSTFVLNPWEPTTNLKELAVTGKLLEELGELLEVVACHLIDQLSDKRRVPNEVSDVLACLEQLETLYGLKMFNRLPVALDSFTQPDSGYTASHNVLRTGARLISSVSRCVIQGIDETEPVTGKPNRDWLRESADNFCINLHRLIIALKLDQSYIMERVRLKAAHQQGWHRMIDKMIEE